MYLEPFLKEVHELLIKTFRTLPESLVKEFREPVSFTKKNIPLKSQCLVKNLYDYYYETKQHSGLPVLYSAYTYLFYCKESKELSGVSGAVFLISLYGAPLAQRASYLALHSSLFGPVAQLIMIILSVTALTDC